jgi:phage major head subunit gpT-like protein
MATGTLNALSTLRGYTQSVFDAEVARLTPFYPRIAKIVNSTGYDEKYAWLANMPAVREWLGERKFKELLAADYTLVNKLWEASVLMELTVVEDNRMGSQAPLIESLAQEAMFHPDELMISTMVAGESSLGFDGQFFFDTDHSFGDSGTQSNDLTSDVTTTTAPTVAEARIAYNAAYAAMIGFKGDNGKPFYRPALTDAFNKNVLVLVPPATYGTFAEAIGPQAYNTNGTKAFVAGNPEVIPISHLTDATKFYTLNVGGSLKPFVFQQRRPLRRQVKGMGDGDIEFKDVKFMVDARYNVGYLAWWNAVLTTFV